ncbi:MAG: glycosyltransferase family 4 protein, partial [Pirellulaceae bacterium]
RVLFRSAQFVVAVRHPVRYVRTLADAAAHRALVEFLIAVYFTTQMHSIDVLYCTFGDRKLFVGYYCKRLTGKPLACTVHAYELYVNPNPALFQIAARACDQLITISDYNRDRLRTLLARPDLPIDVITYSIDLQRYRPRRRFVILIVGFFVQRKGHDILFQAVKQLDRDDLEVWVVGGEGAEATSVDVEALARRYGIESQVAFFGKLSGTALQAVYHACDVFCLPCHFDDEGVGEGFPNVIIEAMACGKPVISTRHVAIPSVLEQVLVDERDVAGLADAIERVAASSSWRDELGSRNRVLAETHFSPANVEATAGILERLSHADRSFPPPPRSRSLPEEQLVAQVPS